MKKFLSRSFEFILIGLTILFMLVKPQLPVYGERISMLFFGSLSFYYLASGILVFLDKKRIGRMLRLMYLFGLWSVSITVIGVMMRSFLMQLDKELLMLSVSSGVGLMLFIWLYYRRLEEKEKSTFQYLIQPLFFRSLMAICIAIAFLIAGDYGIYHLFGAHKSDSVYTEKVIHAYENPKDSSAVNDYKRYDSVLRMREQKNTGGK